MDDGEDFLFWLDFLFWPIVVLGMMTVPVVAAYRRNHINRKAILTLAILLTLFEEYHLVFLSLSPIPEWPMIGWVIMFVWAFARQSKEPLV